MYDVKYCMMIYCSAFRSKKAKVEADKESTDRTTAATRIQASYRMWKCKKVYQQLIKYKEKKDLQMIYFSQQVSILDCTFATTCTQ